MCPASLCLLWCVYNISLPPDTASLTLLAARPTSQELLLMKLLLFVRLLLLLPHCAPFRLRSLRAGWLNQVFTLNCHFCELRERRRVQVHSHDA